MLSSLLRRQGGARALTGAALVLLFAAVAFLLACYELFDNDVWWHLRGGEWVLAHGRAPGLDPFTFGSEDRRWIDLHWLFEVALALAFRAGGVAGMILLAASAASLAVLVALLARRPGTALPAALLAWFPALLLASNRFDPRPEIFSLLFLACYLAVLTHAEGRPRLLWALPAVQLVWANSHALFVLGPVVLGFWLAEHAGRLAWRYWRGEAVGSAPERRWWLHAGGAAAAVGLACLANPYGLDGALFPFALLPKVTQPDNPYKRYIEEFMSARQYVAWATPGRAARNAFFCSFYLLLLLLPLSFLLPAAWRASRAGPAWLWLAALLAAVGLLGPNTLALSEAGLPPWIAWPGRSAPLVLLAGALLGAGLLARRSWPAAGVAAAGGLALAAWMTWLPAHLTGSGEVDPAPLVVAAVAGSLAGLLVLRHGGGLFAMLLAGAFAYLALNAVNSFGRLGLVAGVVLAWNLGPWLGELFGRAEPPRWQAAAGWALRLGLAGLLLGWLAAVVGERYSGWVGEPRRFALRERPLTFAHDAARFAGREGMPDRALVYDVAQACVYVFHNAPERKPFIDSRLELPTLKTFKTYTGIEEQLRGPAPGWAREVRRLGDPLLFLSHEENHNAQAAVLTHPRWRLAYYDALAAVFLPRGEDGLEARFPTLDLGARHFRRPAEPSVPGEPGAAWKEAKALANLGSALGRYPEATWPWRVPALLSALDRAELALLEESAPAGVWTVLGNCYWGLVPDRRARPPSPADGWDPFTAVRWAQASYCFQRALQLAPDDDRAPGALYRCFEVRRMADAQRSLGRRLLARGRLSGEPASRLRALDRLLGPPPDYSGPLPEDVPGAVDGLLRAGRPEQAVRLAGAAAARGQPARGWGLAERLAGAWLHLGEPARARRAWASAPAPSAAVRVARLGCTFWVERDHAAAVRCYERARRADPGLPEPPWALAWIHAEVGQAEAGLRACRAALRLPLPPGTRKELESLQALLGRYVPSEPS
jgi:tetratricopeptide (TPR) repeat protein